MKIALVSPYDFAYPGGVTVHICALERYFTRMGHEVKIIAPASKTMPALCDKFIPIGRPRSIPTSGSIARVTISPWLSKRIQKVLAEERFDIVHLHEPLMPMLCTTTLRLSNSIIIGTFHACHGRPGYNFGKPFGKIILKRWFRRLDGKIAVSKPARDFACEHFLGHYNIIPNGVDVEHFSPRVKPIEKYSDGKLNILFVGRLESRKGFVYMLRAYQRVKEKFPGCRLIVVGPGDRQRRKYENYIKRKGIQDVEFVGFVPYEELPGYYKTADIYCGPATGRESFGIVLLEAMATGKPIVASNIEGYASVLTHGSEGLLVPPRDAHLLAEALLSLMRDEPLRQKMGQNGLRTAQNYSWERVARRVLDYYERLLSEPPVNKQVQERKVTSLPV
ncbi:MAG: glycosyltransferase family 4 protein [Chloroflexi bacterium]|nr:glycosyltransferase family 4 protein [Chloroflexota bacterium]